MKNIFINASFEGDEGSDFLSAIQAILSDLGCSVQTVITDNGTALFSTKCQPVSVEISTAEVDISPSDYVPPAGIDIGILTPDSQNQLGVMDVPSNKVVGTTGGITTIKSLSISETVPFKYDSSISSSQLLVSNVTCNYDIVEFTFCGVAYKYPVEKSEYNNIVSNVSPIFTDMSIRVIVSLNSSQVNYPVLLNVVNVGSVESSVIFGKDLQGIVEEPVVLTTKN